VKRILADHRTRAAVRPLPAAGLVRIQLSQPQNPSASGTELIEWNGENFRETVSSAALKVVRGIQGEKGYFRDEDGITRVASEPIFADLRTRSYFWRRAYLFEDLERARALLGPSDEATVTVGLTPRGGNTLWLTFARADGRLLRAQAIRLDFVFDSTRRFTDRSRRGTSVAAEISSVGLPIATLLDTAVGGWLARWQAASAESAIVRSGNHVLVSGKLSGHPVSIAIDGAEDGPIRVRSTLADQLGLTFATDVFGRSVARGADLAVGPLDLPDLAVERTASLPEGVDVSAGAPFFRETVVEIDPATTQIRFHDPAHWVMPEGLYRVLLDDDGNRPVIIARRNGANVRLLGPTAIDSAVQITPAGARRLGLSDHAPTLSGLKLGLEIPARSVPILDGSESDWDEDGRIGWDLILASRAQFDLAHRWVYLRPTAGQWR
jgi:hypothetical protein